MESTGHVVVKNTFLSVIDSEAGVTTTGTSIRRIRSWSPVQSTSWLTSDTDAPCRGFVSESVVAPNWADDDDDPNDSGDCCVDADAFSRLTTPVGKAEVLETGTCPRDEDLSRYRFNADAAPPRHEQRGRGHVSVKSVSFRSCNRLVTVPALQVPQGTSVAALPLPRSTPDSQDQRSLPTLLECGPDLASNQRPSQTKKANGQDKRHREMQEAIVLAAVAAALKHTAPAAHPDPSNGPAKAPWSGSDSPGSPAVISVAAALPAAAVSLPAPRSEQIREPIPQGPDAIQQTGHGRGGRCIKSKAAEPRPSGLQLPVGARPPGPLPRGAVPPGAVSPGTASCSFTGSPSRGVFPASPSALSNVQDQADMGEMEAATTLMLQNLSNRYNQEGFLWDMIAAGYGPGRIDFLYLPFHFGQRVCQGYGFVNFKDPATALEFTNAYKNASFGRYGSNLRIMIADRQGRQANVDNMRRTVQKITNPRYMPLTLIGNELLPVSFDD